MIPIKPFKPTLSKPIQPTLDPKLQHAPKAAHAAAQLAKDTFERAKSKMDSLSELGQDLQFELQGLMTKLSQSEQARSNTSKKANDAADAVIGNIRG